ncbi:MAG: InlB B-repeat-containing protein [Candidatus Kariarchaeaceae archaeon]|jgi:endonuclease YncB( thermonuclease family)
MRSKGKLILLLLILVFIRVVGAAAQEVDQVSQVTNIVDGDTFDLNTGERVRFADINAPEPNDPGGPEAKQFLTSLILGETVYLDIDDIYRTDYKGDGTRLVCLVFVRHTDTHRMSINEALVQADHAIYKDYENEFSPPWDLYWKYASDPPPSPPPPPPPKKFELRITKEGNGEIDHSIGTRVYEENCKITIIATPDDDWRIKNWVLNEVELGSQESIVFRMTNDKDLHVIFEEIPPSCTLSFNIIDERAQPIEYVKITSLLQPEKQEKIIIITDSKGFDQTDLIYPGSYNFSIFKSDYEIEYRNITLSNGEIKTVNVTLSLIFFNLNIEIVDSNSNPLPNITVQSLVQPEGQEIVSGKTDENGTLIIPSIKTGYYAFIVLGDYIQNTSFDVNLLCDRVIDVSVPVQAFCSLHICVEDQDGDPLSDVLVASTSQPIGQDPLNGTCSEEMLFKGILPGNYSFEISKEGYESVSFSISLFESGYFEAHTVVLIQKWINLTPYILAGFFALMIGTVVFTEIPSRFNTKQKDTELIIPEEEKTDYTKVDDSEKELETNQVIEPTCKIHHPKYFDTGKGKIIRVLYSEGFLSLNELESKSELSKDGFWGAFYGLLGDGELLSNQKGEFSLSNDLKKEWKRYFDSIDSTQESDEVSLNLRPDKKHTRRRSSPYFKGQLARKANSKNDEDSTKEVEK